MKWVNVVRYSQDNKKSTCILKVDDFMGSLVMGVCSLPCVINSAMATAIA